LKTWRERACWSSPSRSAPAAPAALLVALTFTAHEPELFSAELRTAFRSLRQSS